MICSRSWLPGGSSVVVLMLFAAFTAFSANDLEYQVKAAFLLNFTRFIDWPAEVAGDSPTMDICILGDDSFGPILDQTVEGETIQGHRIQVQRIHGPAPDSCRVLFISRSEKHVDTVVESLGSGVLTVGEGESFLRAGGMIAFVVDDRRVRFDVNLTAASKARLMLSAKLLSVARTVLR